MSWRTSASTVATKTSSGSSGIASRAAERRRRAALARGRNTATPPSAWR